MRTTFLVAQRLGVSPFDVMAQELDCVIMVVNFLLESASENQTQQTSALSEKDKDKDFWSAL